MRSRWSAELGLLVAQALVEVLALWLPVTLLQHNAALLAEVSFAHAWALQLSAALAAWMFGRSQRRATLMAAAVVLLLLSQNTASAPPWLLSGYLCLRGLFMGHNVASSGAALRWFRLGSGVCVLVLAFVALSATPRAALPYNSLRSLSIAYLFCGALLTGLHQRRTTFTSALTPAALVSVLAPTLVLLLTSVVLVFGPNASGWMFRAGIATLRNTAALVASALEIIGRWTVSFLRWFGSLFEPTRGTFAPRPPVVTGPSDMWKPMVRFREITLRADTSEVLAVLFLLLATIALVYLIASLARRRAPTLAAAVHDVEEEQQSTLSWQLLLQPLARVRRKRAVAVPPSAAQPRSLRAIYCALLSWAARRGQPRALSTTPSELAETLSAAHPDKRRALRELTDYYTKERYAECPCTEAEQEHARTLLHELTK